MTISIIETIKQNECIARLAQWNLNRPEYFITKILPKYANDVHVNDKTPEERQAYYESQLTTAGLAHELALPNPVETPWGIVRERDGLDLSTLTRAREFWQRQHEWAESATPETVQIISDLIDITRRIIMEEQVSYLAIPPGTQRNEQVLSLIKDQHKKALKELVNGL
jgi:hypothetical protein